MVELGRLAKGLPGRVVAKLEMRNPCGSVKDRVGVALIENAERQGVLRSGMTLVEATGGNTGIGVGFIPEILNRSILDEVIAVTDEDAFDCARRLAREEGILAGVSSGAALHAALAVASRKEAAGRMVVVLLADTGERYVTTALFTAQDSQAE